MGQFKLDYLIDSSTFTTTSTQVWTVPAGKYWRIRVIGADNDNNATVTIDMQKSDGTKLHYCGQRAATTGISQFPDSPGTAVNGVHGGTEHWTLSAGEKIVITWGAAQGATSECWLLYEECAL